VLVDNESPEDRVMVVVPVAFAYRVSVSGVVLVKVPKTVVTIVERSQEWLLLRRADDPNSASGLTTA